MSENSTVKIQTEKIRSLLLFVVVGMGATFLLIWVTTYKLGVTSDSTVYLETAENILAGKGIVFGGLPLTHFPPAYPILLAAAGLFEHGNVLQGGRFSHALLFGANLILIAFAVQMATQNNLAAMGSAVLIYLFSAPNLLAHVMAWSEPLFITFSLGMLILLSLYIQRPRLLFLLGASLMSGLAITTRYAGFSLFPPVVLGLLFLGTRSLRHRLKDILIAAVVTCILPGAWLIHNFMTNQTATDRTFAVHLVGWPDILMFISAIHSFILPITFPDWMMIVEVGITAVLVLAALVILFRKGYVKHGLDSLPIILPSIALVFVLTYIPFLFITISFFDAQTPLDTRILLPLFIFLIAGVVPLFWSLSQTLRKNGIWWIFILCSILSAGVNGYRAAGEAVDIHRNGIGYTNRSWDFSPTLAYLKTIPQDVKIYSNGSDVVLFQTERTVGPLPQLKNQHTSMHNQNYANKLQSICNEIKEGTALIVYLNELPGRWNYPTTGQLVSSCNLHVLTQTNDGTVLGK